MCAQLLVLYPPYSQQSDWLAQLSLFAYLSHNEYNSKIFRLYCGGSRYFIRLLPLQAPIR